MTDPIAVGTHILYAPLEDFAYYRGIVRVVRSPMAVDIELFDTGLGHIVTLSNIPVVPTKNDLVPGTCTASTK